jgi:hypothetical protein
MHPSGYPPYTGLNLHRTAKTEDLTTTEDF